MTPPDRPLPLLELIKEITEGVVWPLDMAINTWGRAAAKRLVADQFAVIRRNGADLDDDTFLPAEEAVVLIDHLRKADECVFMAAPWGAIHFEDEPNLVSRYAQDDPEAVEEVRRIHTEKRARLCR